MSRTNVSDATVLPEQLGLFDGELWMRLEQAIERSVAGLEIKYLLRDPDDDPDRAGDGYYYRELHESGWSGAWLDRAECRAEHRRWLEEELWMFFNWLLPVYAKPLLDDHRRFVLEFDGDVHREFRSLAWSLGDGRVCVLEDARDPETARRICSMTLAGIVTVEEFHGNLTDSASSVASPTRLRRDRRR
jgi:hypothetical protein